MAARPVEPTFVELFTPKLVTVLREGYRFRDLRADALAGLTVAIVALPLSMAIAIASGLTPDRGLYTSIIGGFIVSLLGGSRFQIGGPAGAFIVLVSATVALHGVDGLLLATTLSGVILLAIGLLRLGTFIKYIPFPVTVGFTAGIAVIIASSQVKDFFGLPIETVPADFLSKWQAYLGALPSANWRAMGVGGGALATIIALRKFAPRLPGFLIAVIATSLVVAVLNLPVDTIGSRFPHIPAGLPLPSFPDISLAKINAVLPSAFTIAFLAGIEALLSAVVADGMAGTRHRSNQELIGQGVANLGSALFGGLPATGAIAAKTSV